MVHPTGPQSDWIDGDMVADFARKIGCDQILVIASKSFKTKVAEGRTAAVVIWNNHYQHDGFMQRLKAEVTQLYQRLIKG